MIRRLGIGLLFLAIPAVMPASASATALYSIAWEVKQDASFLKKSCESMSNDAILTKSVGPSAFDYCSCTGKILYPQLNGLPNAEAQSAVNASLAQRVAPDICPETKPYAPTETRTGDRKITRFDVSLANENLLSLLIWHDSYAVGAAHNEWTLEGATFDLASGKALGLTQLIAPDRLAEVNAKIVQSLQGSYPGHGRPAAKAASADGAPSSHPPAESASTQTVSGDGAALRAKDDTSASAGEEMNPASQADQKNPAGKNAPNEAYGMPRPPKSDDSIAENGKRIIETYTAVKNGPYKPADAYITLDGCSGCTYHLTPEGLEIVFQLNEVAPFAEGNPRITIGREYLTKDIREKL